MVLPWSKEAVARHREETGKDPPSFSCIFRPVRTRIDAFTARYGVTWEDLSTRDDRERWIAGGSLKVVDLTTGEVLGERVGYMLDRGQGSRAGFRRPWLFAEETACPEFPLHPNASRRMRLHSETATRSFAFRIARPTTGGRAMPPVTSNASGVCIETPA